MKLATATTAIAATAAAALLPSASGCSRVLENKYDTVVAGRSMDWSHQFYDYLLIHPKGQEMDGGSPTGSNSIQWKSTYGSVVSSIVCYLEYKGMGPGQVCEGMGIDVDTASDGMNEAGLGAHMLYLGEEVGTAYAEPSTTDDINVNYMRLVRYILDNFATVQVTVDALRQVRLTAGNLCFGEGRELGVHVAIEDATGDSAVIEHVGGEMQIYHGCRMSQRCTNNTYELLKQFQPWGGDLVLPKNLPGSVASEDRFVRLKYYIDYAPKPKSEAMTIAIIKSLIASTNVPFGAPYQGGVYPTWWESFVDSTNKVYYFGWLETPNIIWTDFSKINEIGAFEEGQPNLRLKPRIPNLLETSCANSRLQMVRHLCAQEAGKEKKKDKSPKTDKILRGAVNIADK